MTQYWAIAVGINQYLYLEQPLMYAERDAAVLYRYCVDDAEFPQAQCHLLTKAALKSDSTSGDASNVGDGITKAAIDQAVADVVQAASAQQTDPQIPTDDVIWFAFSGYGFHDAGEDYLLAADSNPEKPSTAIALGPLLETLGKAPRPLLLLDLKRLGLSSDAVLGKSALALAEQHGVTVILSCRPDQSPHETLALRQGLFTAALIESLHQSCITVAQLALDLGDRLPRLSEHHWRPLQNPAAFVPDDMRYQLIVPGKPLENPFPVPEEGAYPLEEAGYREADPAAPDPARVNPAALEDIYLGPETAPSPSLTDLSTARPSTLAPSSPALAAPPNPSIPTSPAPIPQATTTPSPPRPLDADQVFWRRIGIWGIGLLSLLILGVVVRNRTALFSAARPRPADDNAAKVETSDEVTSAALTAARAAIEGEQFDDALAWLDTVPPAKQDRDYAALRQAAQSGAGVRPADEDTLQVNAEILAQAIASLNQEREETPVNQASDFARAIAIAGRIQPGQPLYDEAQSYIQRWGNTVVDLAEARAQVGNYVDAIGAAQLIPPTVAAVYPRAQERIQQWQQQLSQGGRPGQRSLVASAEAIIKPSQASSYSEAIAHLRLVQRRDADYDQAQVLFERWSNNILDLAYERAYEGQLSSAIEAAALVPQDSSVYVEAREAIADWQWQIGAASEESDRIGALPDPIR